MTARWSEARSVRACPLIALETAWIANHANCAACPSRLSSGVVVTAHGPRRIWIWPVIASGASARSPRWRRQDRCRACARAGCTRADPGLVANLAREDMGRLQDLERREGMDRPGSPRRQGGAAGGRAKDAELVNLDLDACAPKVGDPGVIARQPLDSRASRWPAPVPPPARLRRRCCWRRPAMHLRYTCDVPRVYLQLGDDGWHCMRCPQPGVCSWPWPVPGPAGDIPQPV
jgi:hypothetical protein